jgi:hypothetical protein
MWVRLAKGHSYGCPRAKCVKSDAALFSNALSAKPEFIASFKWYLTELLG